MYREFQEALRPMISPKGILGKHVMKFASWLRSQFASKAGYDVNNKQAFMDKILSHVKSDKSALDKLCDSYKSSNM